MKKSLGKYSIGVGDRFGKEGEAQLSAVMKAKQEGVSVTPVWNKSCREHTIIGSVPADVRREADEAVKSLGWEDPYFVDADHIGLSNVDEFIECSDFFTLDVADFIGKAASESEIRKFVSSMDKYVGAVQLPGIEKQFEISKEDVERAAAKFLFAVKEARRIYRHIKEVKGAADFVVEVSLDECDAPQEPFEILFILAAIADEGIRCQTIAPRFVGRFNKGVDYVGDIEEFERQFEQNVAVIEFAVREFGLEEGLKLSVHSGSDKFSIYKSINKVLKKFDAGLHIKTAGTTWLEEVIGLAMGGEDGLEIAKEIYRKAIGRMEELCEPYESVIDIEKGRLPTIKDVDGWSGEEFAEALRHNSSCDRYNQDFRQLFHVGYKIAAEMGERYLKALEENSKIIAQNVMENIYERHIKPIFIGE